MDKYSKYKVVDFLADDYFIRSVIEPTPDSEEFWNGLMREEAVDRQEFVAAYMMVESFSVGRPEVPDHLIETLWKRISASNNRKNKPSRRLRRAIIGIVTAACLAGAGFISFAIFSRTENRTPDSIHDLARDYMIKNEMTSDQIQVITGDVTLDVEGEEAQVEYDGNGIIKVNTEVVEIQPAAKAEVQICQLRVPFGKRASIRLADGSLFWLNSGSTIFYPSDFTGNKREIFVDGEVYAEISRDSQRPFVVNTNTMDVTVLGTAFNLSAYRDEKNTSLVLVSGSVSAKPHNRESILVSPNQILTYSEDKITLEEADVESHISWRDGIYIFRNEPIESVLLRIARYYNVSMKLPVSSPGITCSGKLVLKDNLQQLLHGLSQITPMRYVIADGNECLIIFDSAQ